MKNYLLALLSAVVFLPSCSEDRTFDKLTQHTWYFVQAEEAKTFGKRDITEYFAIEYIQFYSDGYMEMKYIDDINIYSGDWTNYRHTTTVDESSTTENRLILDLYHDSELYSFNIISRLTNSKLVFYSDDAERRVTFTFEAS